MGIKHLIIFIQLLTFIYSYDRNKVKAYADYWWDKANHECGTYNACTPWAYYGSEACESYPSHGGDSANFVSQCILEGGHVPLVDTPCRGYPCGKEEISPAKLGECLRQNYGWIRTCGYKKEPPADITIGDVVIFHSASCNDSMAFTAVVTETSGGIKISCHSPKKHNTDYTNVMSGRPYVDWYHYPK